jgi:hypothetical protein
MVAHPAENLERIARVAMKHELTSCGDFVAQDDARQLARPGGAARVHEQLGLIHVCALLGRQLHLVGNMHGDIARTDGLLSFTTTYLPVHH